MTGEFTRRGLLALASLLPLAGCRGDVDQAVDSLTGRGITVQRNVAGEVFLIDAGSAEIGPEFWKTLSDFEKLESVSLSGSPVSDDDLTHLTLLPNLRTLDLSWTHVTSSGLPVLSRLNDLQNLSLNGVALTASSVEGIARLTRLRSLSVMECGLEDEAAARLEAALPGCLIVR